MKNKKIINYLEWKRLSRYQKFHLIFIPLCIALALINQGFELFGLNWGEWAFFIIMLSTLINIFSSKEWQYDYPYHPDPYQFLLIKQDQLTLGKQIIPLNKIKKIAIVNKVKLGDAYYGYLSLPYNPFNGSAPSFYFDEGFYLSLTRYLKKHIPDVELIE